MISTGILAGEGFGLVLSAIFQNPEKTVAFVPIFIIPLALFSGLLVDIGSIPKVLSPIKDISYFRYMYEGLILNEFDQINNCLDGICDVPSKEMSFDGGPNYAWTCVMILGILAVVSRFLAATAFWNAWRGVGK